MFQDWGFLITEMVLLLILAALLGVVVGWIIWGRSGSATRAQAELESCRTNAGEKDAKIATLTAELEAARAEALAAERIAMLAAEEAMPAAEAAAAQAQAEDAEKIHALENARDAALAEAHAAEEAAMLAAAEVVAVAEAVEADHGAHPVHPAGPGTKPAILPGPRGGAADDLTRIKGIGPKLEQLCHALGVYHFDQIAGWTAQEVAWVDANLEGFKGRVSRDKWIDQAKALAVDSGAKA